MIMGLPYSILLLAIAHVFLFDAGVFGNAERQQEKRMQRRALLYICVFFVCWLPSESILRVHYSKVTHSVCMSWWQCGKSTFCGTWDMLQVCLFYGAQDNCLFVEVVGTIKQVSAGGM